MHATLKSNWKGPEFFLDLTKPTILVGLNGEGKSRVTEAMSVALTGSVPDIGGRSVVKDAKLLWRAAPPGAETLYAEVVLINETTKESTVYRWESHRGKKPAWTINGRVVTKAQDTGVSLLLSEMRENLYASVEKASDWLGRALAVSKDDVVVATKKKLARNPAKDAARATVDAVAATVDTAEALVEATNQAHLDATRDADAAAAGKDVVQVIAGPVPTPEEIKAADQAVRDADAERIKVMERRRLLDDAMRVVSDYAQAARARAEITVSSNFNPTVNEIASAAKVAVDTTLRAYPTTTTCPCCMTMVGNPALTAAQLRLGNMLQVGNSARVAAALDAKMTALGLELGTVKATFADSPDLLAWLYAPDKHDVLRGAIQTTAQDVERRYQTAVQARDAVSARVLVTKGIDAAQVDADAQSARAELLGAINKATRSALEDTVQASLAGLLKTAQRYVPPAFGNLILTLRPAVSVGYDRDTEYPGLASGAEETSALLALGLAVAELRGDNRPLLMVGEDRAVDQRTLDAWVRILATPPKNTFVLLQSVMQPTDAAAWSVVDVTALDSPPAMAPPFVPEPEPTPAVNMVGPFTPAEPAAANAPTVSVIVPSGQSQDLPIDDVLDLSDAALAAAMAALTKQAKL